MDRRAENVALLIPRPDSSSLKNINHSTTMNEELGQETSEQKALRNPLVLREIMQRSTSMDLKIFRLVNEAWLQGATKELLKRNRLEIHILEFNSLYSEIQEKKFDDKSVNWTLVDKSQTSLQSFNDSLTHSLYFPCNKFHVGDGCLSCPDVQNFFSSLGHCIKTLHLEDENNVTPKKVFQRILMEQAPFVDTLSIGGFEYHWKEADQLTLPWLTHLILCPLKKYYTGETIKKILVGATKLKVVENFQLNSDLNLFLETGKLDTIKKVAEIGHMVNLEALTKLSVAGPKLEKLKFRTLWADGMSMERQLLFIDAYNKILTSSQKSLKNLDMDLTALPKMKIPLLPNLKKLSLRNLRFYEQPIHNSRCYESQNFPSLQTLCIHFGYMHDTLECTGQFSSIMNLQIYITCSRQLLSKLHECCPNVKKLKIAASIVDDHKYCLIPEICSYWSGLENLQFEVRGSEICKWDEALTGFTEETCRRLLSSRQHQLTVDQNFDNLRIRPWIGHITGLRRLEIHILLPRKTSAHYHTTTTINLTSVSGLYVFKRMSDLVVTIIVNDRTGNENIEMDRELASVSSYATVFHRRG